MTRRGHMILLVGVVAAISGALAQPRGPMGGGWRGGNEDDLGGSLVRTEGSGIIDEDLVRNTLNVLLKFEDDVRTVGESLGVLLAESVAGA